MHESESERGATPSHWWRGSLTRRVLGWMLVVSLLPLFIMAYQGYHCAGQALVEQTQTHLDAVVASRSHLIGQWLHARKADVELLADVFGAGVTKPERYLGQFRDHAPGMAWVAVYDDAGRVVASSAETNSVITELADATRAATGAGIASWSWTEPNGRRYLGYAGRVAYSSDGGQATEGSHGSYVAAALDLSRSLDQLLADQNGLGLEGRLYAVDSDLTILSDPMRDGGTAQGAKADPAIPHQAMGHVHTEHAMFHILPFRPELLRSVARVPGYDWFVVAEADPQEALAWIDTLRTRATVTGLVTLAVLLVVTVGIARSLGRPLRELGRVAQRVRSGRTEERLGPMKGTEAEEVRQAFNQMLDELREKQRELVRAATLASVGELSSSIVHEMRNPLSSIKMNLQALRLQVASDPGYRELAEIASEQVHRVESMLDDLLKYGRPVELHRQPTTFRELADAALAVVGDAARTRGIDIRVEDALNGQSVHVDREQMCRALTNLLLNAVQALPEHGRVVFSGRCDEASERVVIDVCDNGAGFSQETEERLFKPFFTTKPNGTGLGLANVRKIVELHDGAVSASNHPGGGACFTVTLPVL